MANNTVAQGTLNRVRASVSWSSYPSLNVTAAFLGKGGISSAPQGPITTRIETLTGIVNSPEPFQQLLVTIHLLKTQSLAAQYIKQLNTNSLLGSGTIRPDASTFPAFDITNSAIMNYHELTFSGTDPGFAIEIIGYMPINSSLWL